MGLSDPSVYQEPSASERVITIVADRERVDPTDLEVPLFTAVDPELLDDLVRSAADGEGRSPLRVEFTYYGYDVVVASDGSVRVTNGR